MRLLKLKSVLVATDLDESAAPALRTAARIASLAEARLHLLHVAAERQPDDESRLLDLFRHAVPDASDPASVRVARGAAADLIVQEAARLDADVVVLGPHRRGANQDRELGSTAAKVVRTAPCPCLVTGTELRLPLENVVAAIDLSEAAGGVLSVALSWTSALRPRRGTARLAAVHVASRPDESTAQRIREEVQRTRKRGGDASYVEVFDVVESGGEPADEILRRAAADAADLLVVGTREGGEPVAELGSVSAAIARTTTCPLLLVPPTAWQDAD